MGLTATLTPRNNCSVAVKLSKSSLKKSVRPKSNVVCLVEFWRCDSLEVCSKRACSRCGMGGSPGELSEGLVTEEKRKKGWTMGAQITILKGNASIPPSTAVTQRSLSSCSLANYVLPPCTVNSCLCTSGIGCHVLNEVSRVWRFRGSK